MSFRLTLETIDEFIHLARSILGEGFVANSLEIVDVERGTIFEQIRAYRRAHPLAVSWQVCLAELNASKARGALKSTKPSIDILKLVVDLIEIQCVPNSEAVVERIRNRENCFGGMYEAEVLANYVRSNFQCVVVVSEDKAPDFMVTDSNGKPFEVECKSLRNRWDIELAHWREIVFRVSEDLVELGVSANVRLSCNRPIDGKDIEPVRSALLAHTCNQTPLPEALAHSLNIELRLVPAGKVLANPIYPGVGRHVQIVETAPDGIVTYGASALVHANAFRYTNYTKTIFSEISTANKQLSGNRPSIVHIQIPVGQDTEMSEVIDACWSRLFHRLKTFYPKISAVSLDTHTISYLAMGESPITHWAAVVPNVEADLPLPSELRLPGWWVPSGVDASQMMREGHISFARDLLHWTEYQQRGQAVAVEISEGGRFQFWLWRMFNDSFRVEVVTPALGRIYADFALNSLWPDRQHKFAVSFNKDEIILAVDGEIIPRVG